VIASFKTLDYILFLVLFIIYLIEPIYICPIVCGPARFDIKHLAQGYKVLQLLPKALQDRYAYDIFATPVQERRSGRHAKSDLQFRLLRLCPVSFHHF